MMHQENTAPLWQLLAVLSIAKSKYLNLYPCEHVHKFLSLAEKSDDVK